MSTPPVDAAQDMCDRNKVSTDTKAIVLALLAIRDELRCIDSTLTWIGQGIHHLDENGIPS